MTRPLTVSDRTTGLGVLTAPVNVVGPMPDGSFHVHAAGCADLGKSSYKRADAYGASEDAAAEVSSMRDVVLSVYGPEAGSFLEEQGMTEDDWKAFSGDFIVKPCVSLPDEPIAVEAPAAPAPVVAEPVALEPTMRYTVTADEYAPGFLIVEAAEVNARGDWMRKTTIQMPAADRLALIAALASFTTKEA